MIGEKAWTKVSMLAPLLVAFGVASIACILFLDLVDATFGISLAGSALFVAAVDIDRFEIPDFASFTIFALGVVWTQVSGIDIAALTQSVLRSISVVAILFVLRVAYRLVRGIEGLGLGDVKLAGAGAAWLSVPYVAVAVLIAVGAAVAAIVGHGVVTGERVKANSAVPFGTFLAPAIWMAWFAQVSGL
jgi:leader peptidase (prepilin peptidase) / N-methyltransferase